MSKSSAMAIGLRIMGFWAITVTGLPRLPSLLELCLKKPAGAVGLLGFQGLPLFAILGGVLLVAYSRRLGRFLSPEEGAAGPDETEPEDVCGGMALSVLGAFVITLAASALLRTGLEALGLRHAVVGSEARTLAHDLRIQLVFGLIQLAFGVGLFLQRRGLANVWRGIQERRRLS